MFPSLLAVFFATGFAPESAEGRTSLWGVDSIRAEELVPEYTLPDPLVTPAGERISTVAGWEAQRPRLLRLFETQMYGELPPALQEAGDHPPFVTFRTLEAAGSAFGGKAIRRQVAIEFRDPTTREVRQTALLLLYLPASAVESGPVPVFLGLNFRGNHTIAHDPEILVAENVPAGDAETLGVQARRWPVELLLENGFALATLHYCQLVPDRSINPDSYGELTEGLFGIYSPYDAGHPRPDSAWGFISAWAWGLSRAMDYLETDAQIDPQRVALIGHSRLGKTALWCGARDTRFAVVISNNSGCGGAALNYREFGERVLLMNTVRPYWFCLNWKRYGERVSGMPFDAHTLLALIAPRPVYVASASEDWGADPRGEFLATVHATPVYELYGKPEAVGYHLREGGHDILRYDWERYIRFAQAHFSK